MSVAVLLAALALSGSRFDSEASHRAQAQDAAQRAPTALEYELLVAAESADEVYKVRFDGERLERTKTIAVGTLPTEIEGPHGLAVAPDGASWYLTLAHGKPFGALLCYDAETDHLRGQVELGLFPATIAVSEASGLVYCVNFALHAGPGTSTVSIVDPEAMVEVARVTTGATPHGSRTSPDGTKHYSCSMGQGELFEIDALHFEVTRVLALADPDKPGMAMPKPTWVQPHPSQSLVYVALSGSDEVAEVDLATWSVRRRFATDKGPYNLGITPDGGLLVASCKSAGTITVIDLVTGKERARLRSSRSVTHGVAMSPDGRYAFVTSEGVGAESGNLDVVDLERLTLVDSLELGLQAGGIAFLRAVPKGS